MTDWHQILNHIARETGESLMSPHPQSVGGGCINTTVKLVSGERAWFVKLNQARLLSMFEAEAEGLAELAASGTLRVPRPVCSGVQGDQAYLVMEYIEMGRGGGRGHVAAGERLAAMHRVVSGEFGWHRDNTIGATHQPNAPCGDWVDFWRERRLGFQLQLAADNGYGGRLQVLGERLLEAFPVLIDHDPAPSLLHGDLWGGNLAFDTAGEPVIFDPAVYYGDREADLAMTELFGGFGKDFYDAYNAAWPLDVGYPVRKRLYNLYHILNHLNLFGSGYLGQAQGMMEGLLAETGQ